MFNFFRKKKQEKVDESEKAFLTPSEAPSYQPLSTYEIMEQHYQGFREKKQEILETIELKLVAIAVPCHAKEWDIIFNDDVVYRLHYRRDTRAFYYVEAPWFAEQGKLPQSSKYFQTQDDALADVKNFLALKIYGMFTLRA